MKILLSLSILLSVTSYGAEDKKNLEVINIKQDCRVTISRNINDVSCIKITNLSGTDVKMRKCVTNGCLDDCREKNYYTKFQVHEDQINGKNLYFSAWVDGGLNTISQNYLKLKKVVGGYKAFIDRQWILGERDTVICDKLLPPQFAE